MNDKIIVQVTRNKSEVRLKIRSRIKRVLILVKSDMWTQKSRNDMFKNTKKDDKEIESSVTEVEELSVQRNQGGKVPHYLRHMIS